VNGSTQTDGPSILQLESRLSRSETRTAALEAENKRLCLLRDEVQKKAMIEKERKNPDDLSKNVQIQELKNQVAELNAALCNQSATVQKGISHPVLSVRFEKSCENYSAIVKRELQTFKSIFEENSMQILKSVSAFNYRNKALDDEFNFYKKQYSDMQGQLKEMEEKLNNSQNSINTYTTLLEAKEMELLKAKSFVTSPVKQVCTDESCDPMTPMAQAPTVRVSMSDNSCDPLSPTVDRRGTHFSFQK